MDLNNIHEDWKEDAPNLASMEVANPFTVPENYFNQSKEQILARLTIERVAGTDIEGAFAVPEGYFTNLPEQIISRANLESLKEEEGFLIPENYFETLTENISSRIKVEELVTQSIPDKQLFSVPEGYFEKLQANILLKTVEAEYAPVVQMRSRTTQWIRFAAAACITAMIGTGIFLNYSKPQDSDIDSALAQIPDTEIVSYLQASTSIDDSETIAEHLAETGIEPKLQNEEFSEEEIKTYLETSL